ncbi:MAG: T9SS type A sorting domain-containing protein [candidate division Zixibacteria bacterium]|nr:T9SS type A sorting domain-containing protein [candidate division Zixibacteria bacterium]
MKKIKLTLVSVLVLLLVFMLVLEGKNPQAKSKSNTFEMTSDVLCGTGGGSQSNHFTLQVSAGAQGSPIGPQSSINFWGGGGWVYTAEPAFIWGDANGDGVIDLGDVVFLINYLFKFGVAPCPIQAGDANCDGTVDLGDVVYLINYLFKGGPPPSSGKTGGVLAKVLRLSRSLGHAQISLLLKTEPMSKSLPGFAKGSPQGLDEVSQISVKGKFDRDVAGVQLEIEFNPDEVTLLDPALTPLTKGLQLFSGIKDGTQKIGIVDLSGKNFLPAGEGNLVNLRAKGEDLTSIKIKKAILVDGDAMPLVIELSHELNRNLAKTSSPLKRGFQESTPQHFSLSQNYPNPFNPQTSIRYALPQDAQVKLVIYNILGEKVKTLVDEHQFAGYQVIWWDGKDERGDKVASGVYFYRLEAEKFSEVKKMLLVK